MASRRTTCRCQENHLPRRAFLADVGMGLTGLALGELPRGLPRVHPSRALGAVAVLMTKPRRIAQAGRVLKQAQSSQFEIRAILMREPRQVVETPSLLLARAMLRRQRGQDRG